MRFKEIKISDLTGVLKSYAEAEDKKGNNNNKIDFSILFIILSKLFS